MNKLERCVIIISLILFFMISSFQPSIAEISGNFLKSDYSVPVCNYSTSSPFLENELPIMKYLKSAKFSDNPFSEYPINNSLKDINNRYAPNELIIQFKDNVELTDIHNKQEYLETGIQSIDELIDRYKVTSVKPILTQLTSHSLSKTYKITISKEVNLREVISVFADDPAVVCVEPNIIYENFILPNDPLFDMQWALSQTNDFDIDAPEGWDIEKGDSEVIVAVLDTGIDYNHIDIRENIWLNSQEIPDNNLDDDNNGYIDDIHGWDVSTDDNDPIDDFGHGTHCAGVIAAQSNNGLGIAGLSWNGTIMPVRLGSSDGFYIEDAYEGIIYAVDNGARIISMSWGADFNSNILHNAISYAAANDVVLIASAGNYNSSFISFFPAAYEEVISVGATDQYDKKAVFSNYDPYVDVAAPGVNIISLRANGTDMYSDGSHIVDEYYYIMSGTSASCPFVAGLAALLISKNQSLTTPMVKTIICNSVDQLQSSFELGRGRININQALQCEPAIVQLDKPNTWTDIKGAMNIYGSAWGTSFQSYSLIMGMGKTPAIWIELINATVPVSDNILCEFNTTESVDGFYTLKLVVNCANYTYYDTIFFIINNECNNFIVDDNNFDGPWDGSSDHPFKLINQATDNAGDNDRVYIRPGTYHDQVIIYSSIVVEGDTNNLPRIFSPENSGNPNIQITSDNVHISNLLFEEGATGIYLNPMTQNITIFNNIFNHTTGGILISSFCRNNTISNNFFLKNFICIDLRLFADNNNISYNKIQNNEINGMASAGIQIIFGSGNRFFQNNITFGISAISLIESYKNDISQNKFIEQKATLSIKKVKISFGFGIYLYNSSENIIKRNLFTRSRTGIQLYNSPDNIISQNNFIQNQRNAKFLICKTNFWDANYWDRARLFPKPIMGRVGKCIYNGTIPICPWLNFDIHPAQTPYQI